MQLSEQEIIRREKLGKLRELGINPYPADLYPVDHTSKKVKQNFEEDKKVVLAGRLMSRRIQGKASFAELQDSKGKIQVYFNRDEICTGEDKSKYNDVYKKLLDIGFGQKAAAIDQDVVSGNLPDKRSPFGHLGQYVLGRLVDRDARGKSGATSHRLKRVSYRGCVTHAGEDIAGLNA